MFNIELDPNRVIAHQQQVIAELSSFLGERLAMERAKSEVLEQALMKVHQGETIVTGPSSEPTTGPSFGETGGAVHEPVRPSDQDPQEMSDERHQHDH